MTIRAAGRKPRTCRPYAPRHRDPDDYDLPPGEWMCLHCAGNLLGVRRGQFQAVAAAAGLDRYRAKPLDGGYPASFVDSMDARRLAARRRAEGLRLA